jgi:lipopolysaccharide biosynthesis glycosyltransferase
MIDSATVVLVAGADDQFAMPLTVTLTSALRHLDPARRVVVIVLDGGMSETNLAHATACLGRARPAAVIEVVRVEQTRFFHLPTTEAISAATYLRLLVAEVVPDQYERVLYLDSDLVITRDVSELWNIELGGKALWAVPSSDVDRHYAYFRDTFTFLDLPEDPFYFNAGVLLINMPRFREQKVAQRCLEFLAAHSERCPEKDQDGLNAVVIGDWGALPDHWNMQLYGRWIFSETLKRNPNTPGIIHYLGPDKPWRLGGPVMARRAFYEAFPESGWLSPAAARAWVLQRWVHDRASRLWHQRLPRAVSQIQRQFSRGT